MTNEERKAQRGRVYPEPRISTDVGKVLGAMLKSTPYIFVAYSVYHHAPPFTFSLAEAAALAFGMGLAWGIVYEIEALIAAVQWWLAAVDEPAHPHDDTEKQP
jgi:hypothetical protein